MVASDLDRTRLYFRHRPSAVPLAAAIGVIARFALRQYLASPLYRGTDAMILPPVTRIEIETDRKADLDA